MDRHPRLCLSAGHGEGSRHAGQSDPGADVKYDGRPDLTEDDYTLAMAKSVYADLHGLFVHNGGYVMLRNSGVYYRADDEAVLHGCDLFLEIHTNSGGGHGTEALYESASGRAFAESLAHRVSSALGITDRGAKHRTDLAVLTPHSGMVSGLVELWFGDSKGDVAAHHAHRDAEVLAIVNAILHHYGWTEVKSRPSKWTTAERMAYKPF